MVQLASGIPWRILLCGLGLLFAAGCERVSVMRPPPDEAGRSRPAGLEGELARAAGRGDHVLVLYPQGACSTGALEIQVYAREARPPGWRPHPEHPRIRAGSVQREDPARLLNELRVRCVDPEARRRPSAWVVGARLRD